jgi:hypothetical protein
MFTSSNKDYCSIRYEMKFHLSCGTLYVFILLWVSHRGSLQLGKISRDGAKRKRSGSKVKIHRPTPTHIPKYESLGKLP